jgi:hypothetical protein
MLEFDTEHLGDVRRIDGFCVIGLQREADECAAEVSYLHNVIGSKASLTAVEFPPVGIEKLLTFLRIKRLRYATEG